MATVEVLRPDAQDVEEAWNAFRVLVRQGLADHALWNSNAWLATYAAAEDNFNALYRRWTPKGRS